EAARGAGEGQRRPTPSAEPLSYAVDRAATSTGHLLLAFSNCSWPARIRKRERRDEGRSHVPERATPPPDVRVPVTRSATTARRGYRFPTREGRLAGGAA